LAKNDLADISTDLTHFLKVFVESVNHFRAAMEVSRFSRIKLAAWSNFDLFVSDRITDQKLAADLRILNMSSSLDNKDFFFFHR